MRLVDLDPHWITIGTREMAGVSFACPCATCVSAPTRERVIVLFRNPVDGGDPLPGDPRWNRTGDSFETLTLTPSIDCSERGHFHGHITNGEVT